jgi:hypothetical protein
VRDLLAHERSEAAVVRVSDVGDGTAIPPCEELPASALAQAALQGNVARSQFAAA